MPNRKSHIDYLKNYYFEELLQLYIKYDNVNNCEYQEIKLKYIK